MSDHLAILEASISDVGYWRWWAEALPAVFQVEFGGVQLHFPSMSPSEPPNDVVALRFHRPTLVAFLTSVDAESVAPEWRLALHDDKIEPFAVNHDLFTLTSEQVLQDVASGCVVEHVVGNTLASSTEPSEALLAFRAQEVGLIVRAARLSVLAVPGELSADQVTKAAGDWWDYWREYWSRRDTSTPMPKDYACEVTIPLK